MFCGIDIGGTHISVGLVSSDGNIACSEMVQTRTVAGVEDMIDVLADVIFRLKKQRLAVKGYRHWCAVW